MEYLNFDLEVIPEAGRDYRLSVRSPAGEASSRLRFPYDDLALENHLLKLQNALLRSGGPLRRALTEEEQAVQTFGTALFQALMTGEVGKRYAVSRERAEQEEKGLRLRLHIQEARLAVLPWEYLFDPEEDDYVGLSRVTPIVRYLNLPRVREALSITPPLRILAMAASPTGQAALDIQQERTRLERALAGLQAQGLVKLTWLAGQTWRDLQQALWRGPWHIFHFIGHGGFHEPTQEGLLALADEHGNLHLLRATQLGRMLRDHRSLRLVFLNACEGARGGQRDLFSSIGATLAHADIPAILAMQQEITDRAAIELTHTFYASLAAGLPVDAAVTEARIAINVGVTNSLEWGTPVLYLRASDSLLFQVPPRESGAIPSLQPQVRAQGSPGAERVQEPATPLPQVVPEADPGQQPGQVEQDRLSQGVEEERARQAAEAQARQAEEERARKAEEEDERAQQAGDATVISSRSEPDVKGGAERAPQARVQHQTRESVSAPPAQGAGGMTPPSLVTVRTETLQRRRGLSKGTAMLLVGLAVLAVVGSLGFFFFTRSNPQSPYSAYRTLAFDDPLSDNSHGHGWAEDTNKYGTCAFTQGAYQAKATLEGGTEYCQASNTTFSDFDYEVRMTIVKGGKGGIVFRNDTTTGTSYYLFLGQDGTYALWIFRCTSTDCVSGGLRSGSSPAINTGLNQTNLIAAVARGSTIDLYVNTQHIDSVSDSGSSQGHIGVGASDVNGPPSEVVFRDAKVWTP